METAGQLGIQNGEGLHNYSLDKASLAVLQANSASHIAVMMVGPALLGG